MNETVPPGAGTSPKVRHAFVIVHLGVPDTWSESSEQYVIDGIERLLMVDQAQVGPGGAVLHALFVQLPPSGRVGAILERYRKEYPLRPTSPNEKLDVLAAESIRHDKLAPDPYFILTCSRDFPLGVRFQQEDRAIKHRDHHIYNQCPGDHMIRYVTR